MQDFIKVSLNPGSHDSFFAIFDAHGGPEAGDFARKNLMEKQPNRKGFIPKNNGRSSKPLKMVLFPYRVKCRDTEVT